MGFPLICPHMLIGIGLRRAASMAMAINFSTAGSAGLYSPTTSLLLRSTARVYWIRSLVPMLRKSTSSTKRSIIITAAGTSTIMPTGMLRLNSMPCSSRSSITSASTIFAWRSSSSVEIRGNMICRFPRRWPAG